MKFDFILDGLEGFGEGIVQQTALLLTYKRIMGEISEATYQSSIAKLDELRALERMNEGVEDGTVTQGEYFRALKDGVVTLEE